MLQHFIYEIVINTLVQQGRYYQLHQFLQYHVVDDSKPVVRNAPKSHTEMSASACSLSLTLSLTRSLSLFLTISLPHNLSPSLTLSRTLSLSLSPSYPLCPSHPLYPRLGVSAAWVGARVRACISARPGHVQAPRTLLWRNL